MKVLYFLIPFFFINACKTQTGNVISSDTKAMEQVNNSKNECPDGGTCTVEVHQNKTLVLKEDGIGALYPEMENGNNIVVQYTYSKEGPEGTVDGNYSETIHFEIPASATTVNKEGAALSEVKLLYGKHCFCKGDAGYYRVNSGTLILEKNNNAITFDLKFRIDKTSQVVSHISETVKL